MQQWFGLWAWSQDLNCHSSSSMPQACWVGLCEDLYQVVPFTICKPGLALKATKAFTAWLDTVWLDCWRLAAHLVILNLLNEKDR